MSARKSPHHYPSSRDACKKTSELYLPSNFLLQRKIYFDTVTSYDSCHSRRKLPLGFLSKAQVQEEESLPEVPLYMVDEEV